MQQQPQNLQTNCQEKKKLYLRVSVFSIKVILGDTSFTSPTGDGTTILCCHLCHTKIQPFAGQRKCLHFSVIFRPLVLLVRPQKSSPQPPTLQSSALPTELILPKLSSSFKPCLLSFVLHVLLTFIRQESINEWFSNTMKDLLFSNTVIQNDENRTPQGWIILQYHTLKFK